MTFKMFVLELKYKKGANLMENIEETTDRGVDEFGYYPGEAEAELDAYLNTNEAQLSVFTTQELNDEIFRRMFEPYQNELKKLRDKLEEMSAF